MQPFPLETPFAPRATRTRMVRFMASDAELERLKQLAEENECSMSEVIRRGLTVLTIGDRTEVLDCGSRD